MGAGNYITADYSVSSRKLKSINNITLFLGGRGLEKIGERGLGAFSSLN